MSALVCSDLHLGLLGRGDCLANPLLRPPLLDAIDAADELVLLGDLIELRQSPAGAAFDRARDALAAIGQAAAGKRVTIVPGNHDHALLRRWLNTRLGRSDGARLGSEQRFSPTQSSELALAVAETMGPAGVEFAYPGVWLRHDVYATHGHYLDRHLTMPTVEVLGIRLAERFGGRSTAAGSGTPDEYEHAAAPVFAVLHALAQRAPAHRAPRATGTSQRMWRVLSGPGRPVHHRAFAKLAVPGFIAAANRAGLGPFLPELTGAELRRSALRAMREVVASLGIDAQHVLFGHTHRVGPLAGDDMSEWALPGGAILHNSGSWVYHPIFSGRDPGASPYWPGTAIRVDRDGDPVALRLLDDRCAEDLRPPR